jgi:streptogrisin C
MRSRTQLVVLGLLAAVVVTPTAARAGESADPNPQFEAQVAAYQRDYPGLGEAAARRAAAGQEWRIQLLEQLQTEPAGFGGSWYDPVTDVQHVNAVGAAAAARVVALGAGTGLTITTHQVQHSLTELEDIAAGINAGSDPVLGKAAMGNAFPDPVANRVTVRLPSADYDRVRNSGPPPAVVDLVEGDAPEVVPEACVSRFSCSTPLRGGIVLWGGNHGNQCSLGYTALAADGSRWAITAGHCGDITGAGPTWGHGTGAIGPMVEGVNSGNVDVARIQITNPYWQAGGWMYDYYAPNTPAKLHYAITARGTVQAGDGVCLNAWHSDANNCGIILNSYDVRGMPVTSYDACPGDSGGTWFNITPGGRRIGYGVHMGGPASCKDHEKGYSYFTAIPDLNAHWDRTTAARLRIEYIP